MDTTRKKTGLTHIHYAAIVVCSLVGLYALGHFDPLPEVKAEPNSAYIYYGPLGETVPVKDISDSDKTASEAALEGVDYYGAVAMNPSGKMGIWTGAWTAQRARSYALATCGTDCRIIAERWPLHRDPAQKGPVATAAMARNLAVKWPFTKDIIATGGAGAWGHRTVPPGKTGRARAMREAAADCEIRRTAEATPEGVVSPPCRVQTLSDIVDLRPKPDLYPASYVIDLTTLAPVAETQIHEYPDAPRKNWLGPYLPPRLHGARAANGASAFEVVRHAGWPEAGRTIALLKCNAELRPGEVPCVQTHARVPQKELPADVLAVPTKMHESFLAWERTLGAGAFAISPYGTWGFSHDYENVNDAIQKAADWCWYNTRKDWEYRQVDKAFLDAKLDCRIVAVRE